MNPIPTPRRLDLELTSRCNARCRYCYQRDNPGVDYRDLPTEAWLGLFGEMGRARVLGVGLAGGEPFLREDFFALVSGIVRNRMRFQVLTNGSMLTPETVGSLREAGRCDRVQVSLDGSTAGPHEAMRGPGTYGPALEAIRLLSAGGVPVTVRVTVHRENLDDLPALARLLLEELALPSFSTNAATPLGSASKYGRGLFLSAVERLRAMRLLESLDARYPGRVTATAGPLAEARRFREMEAARREGRSLPGGGRLSGCGCVAESLAVRSDGSYIPCLLLPQLVLGRVARDPLEAVWRESPLLARFRARGDTRLEDFAECRDCPWRETCTGNCPGTSLSLTGEAFAPSPDGCLRRFVRDLAEGGIEWSP